MFFFHMRLSLINITFLLQTLHNFRLGAHFTKFHQTVLPSVSGDLEVTDLIVAGVDSPVRSLLSTAGIWGWGSGWGGQKVVQHRPETS